MIHEFCREAPGWLSLGIRVLISVQVLTSGLWIQAPSWAPTEKQNKTKQETSVGIIGIIGLDILWHKYFFSFSCIKEEMYYYCLANRIKICL